MYAEPDKLTGKLQMTASLLPYALLFTGILLAANLLRKKEGLVRAVALALLAWTLLESGWSILQTLRDGVANYRYPFIVTGSFRSPASFGALIAIGLVTAAVSIVRLRKERDLLSRIQYILSLIVLIPGLIALIVSRSRAAWVALLVSLLILLFRETDFGKWIRKRRLVAVAAAALLVLTGAGMFLMKPDSAIGRFHIWHMECRVLAEHPWTGVDFEKMFKVYGDVQSEYFQQKERPQIIVRVADSPVYAFNEYLKFGMAWGIGGLLLSVAVAAGGVWLLFRKRSILAYAALLYAVFAFASFPLSVPQLKVLGTVLLALAIAPDGKRHPWWLLALWGIAFCAATVAAIRTYPEEKARRNAERIWRSALMSKQDTEDFTARLQPLYPSLKDNPMYLYQYGFVLYQSGAYEESNSILQQGADQSCDPALHTTMAQNHLALGNYEAAESELMKAHWLAPGRIAPLWMLMRMYADSGRTAEAIETGRAIQDMPVNQNNADMVALYDQAMALLNELDNTKKQYP